MPAPLEIIQEPGKAAAVFDPQRLRLLEHLKEPDSAAGIARRLQLSRQQVNYHLRELEKAQLIVLVGERRKGNCVERLLQATAQSYLISPEVLGAMLPPLSPDRFSSAYLAATAARAVAELASLRSGAAEAGKKVATLTLSAEVRFATPATRLAFATDITAAFSGVIAKYHDEAAAEGRTFRVFLGGYPSVKTTADTNSG
jgi:DNA-binding transcriptional ArsR family regulator